MTMHPAFVLTSTRCNNSIGPSQQSGLAELMSDNRSWPPPNLRRPSTSGAHGTLRFAFFADKRRLLVESGETLLLFDCGAHQICEVEELIGQEPALAFTSQSGRHPISDLRLIN
jgi:hypothetical protein